MFPSNLCQMSHSWNIEAGIPAYQGGRAMEVYQSTLPASRPHPTTPVPSRSHWFRQMELREAKELTQGIAVITANPGSWQAALQGIFF